MSYRITSACVNCWACQPLCPNDAVRESQPHFIIDSARCTGCEGDFADPQCVSICPIEGAILTPTGEAANPPGSLTGIPPAAYSSARAQIQAR